MRFGWPVLMFVICITFSGYAAAQILSQTPRCITLSNQSGYSAIGSVSTARFVAPDGTLSFHRQNFRMQDGASREFCATGPFYPSFGLEVQLRSLFPIWTCMVPAQGQVITIQSRQNSNDSPVQMYMDCEDQ